MSRWKRHADPVTSARILLSESVAFAHYSFQAGNIRGLAFISLAVIESVRNFHVQQIAMDATFGTNNEGHYLYAILAAVEGVSIPLAYCTVSHGVSGQFTSGATTSVIEQFLLAIQSHGINPAIISIDKDQGEINACGRVFPQSKVQLCLWHVLRAVGMKLASKDGKYGLNKYLPQEAVEVAPFLEIYLASLPDRRPSPHRNGACTYSCKDSPPLEPTR